MLMKGKEEREGWNCNDQLALEKVESGDLFTL